MKFYDALHTSDQLLQTVLNVFVHLVGASYIIVSRGYIHGDQQGMRRYIFQSY